MRDAFGGIINLSMIVIFLVLVCGYLAFNVNYTKAFRVKNYIITSIEQYEGNCDPGTTCNQKITEYIKKVGYNAPDFSLDGYTCVPMPKFNVVTLKKFESDADTYVMPYQQAAFFLYNSYKPAEFTSGGGFEAEIPLPLEDYNDPMAISVVGYSLDYKRDLLESILELSNNERAKSELFFNGKPSPEAEKFLNIDRDISKDIDKNLEREF